MNLEKREDGWWIVDVPDTEACGPYATRDEAAADMRGLGRFSRYGDDPQFITSERRIAMKKDEVKIGQTYMAKVTNSEVPVRIDAENQHGGWDAKNVATGRKVRIKSAQRLRRKCTQADLAGLGRPTPKRRKKTARGGNTSPTAATGAKKPAKGTSKAKGKKAATRAKQGDKGGKKPSGLDAAARVLAEAKEPMGVREIVKVAFEKGYWKSDGQTPHATIYSAMIREIATKSKDSRFKKVARGRFTVNS